MTDRPTKQQLAKAHGTSVPDVIGPGLRVLFCGINPGLYSGATGYHFARPGNRFWPALHAGGFTTEQLKPSQQAELLEVGLGITNLVARTTARADELSTGELHAGGQQLREKVQHWRPVWLAVVGITAYRSAFGCPNASVGRQERDIAGAEVWVLPNPSGLNAHWGVAELGEQFGQLRVASAPVS